MVITIETNEKPVSTGLLNALTKTGFKPYDTLDDYNHFNSLAIDTVDMDYCYAGASPDLPANTPTEKILELVTMHQLGISEKTLLTKVKEINDDIRHKNQ
jgi:hypothetical protein